MSTCSSKMPILCHLQFKNANFMSLAAQQCVLSLGGGGGGGGGGGDRPGKEAMQL